MEIKAKLLKPYKKAQKLDFIVEQNHNKGYEIRETKTELEAWGYTETEKQEMQRTRLDNLSLTKREIFLAIYKDKGISPDDIKSEITDTESVIEFDYSNSYYRGNPLVNMIGEKLGYTQRELDYLFEHKDFPSRETEAADV